MIPNRKFELVVPAYNEARNLGKLLVDTIMAAQKAGFAAEDFRLVIVNNGSTDDSANLLTELKRGEQGDWFEIVTLAENQGYGFGIWSGLLVTTAPVVGWSHADLQCPPENAFKAWFLLGGSQKLLIKGHRYGRALSEKFVTRSFELAARAILGLDTPEINAQPKIFHRDLLRALKEPPRAFAFDLYVLYQAKKLGYAVKSFEVLFPPRAHGVSRWAYSFLSRYKTIWGMVKYMVFLARTEGRL